MMETQSPPQEEYSLQLERILRTNPQKKAERLLERFTGAKVSDEGSGDKKFIPECVLSQAIKCNQRCIDQLQIVRDNLLSAFMAINGRNGQEEIIRQLMLTVTTLINMVGESSSLSQKLNENAMGLHVVEDYLRSKEDFNILDFSKSKSRLQVSHFSCNEATTMCLTWLHKSAEKVSNSEIISGITSIRENSLKMFSSFASAMGEFKDSSVYATQIFRVLLYCNLEGKKVLQSFLGKLKPQEINDIISEIQIFRRQFDEINLILEKLGWSLADIWSRCTGKQVNFEDVRKDGCSTRVNELEKSASAPQANLSNAKQQISSSTAMKKSSSLKNKPSSLSSSVRSTKTKPNGEINQERGPNAIQLKKKSTKTLKDDAKFALKLEFVLGKGKIKKKHRKESKGSSKITLEAEKNEKIKNETSAEIDEKKSSELAEKILQNTQAMPISDKKKKIKSKVY